MFHRLGILLALVTAVASPMFTAAAPRPERPERIVSLIPAATEILFAIGAGPNVVGVGSFDRFPPEVATRPRVGGLVDPDTERILALQPTLVVVYETQAELRTRLGRSAIKTFPYRHGSVADIYDTIRQLGAATGRSPDAETVVARMQTEINAVTASVRSRRSVPALFVVGRDPGALRHVYVAGGQGFLNELVELAGGSNVFRDIARPAAEVSTEQLLSRRPEAIVELWPERSLSQDTRDSEMAVWDALPALPAVRAHHVVEITDERLAIPGPRLPSGIQLLADALHPAAVAAKRSVRPEGIR